MHAHHFATHVNQHAGEAHKISTGQAEKILGAIGQNKDLAQRIQAHIKDSHPDLAEPTPAVPPASGSNDSLVATAGNVSLTGG